MRNTNTKYLYTYVKLIIFKVFTIIIQIYTYAILLIFKPFTSNKYLDYRIYNTILFNIYIFTKIRNFKFDNIFQRQYTVRSLHFKAHDVLSKKIFVYRGTFFIKIIFYKKLHNKPYSSNKNIVDSLNTNYLCICLTYIIIYNTSTSP